MIEPIIDIAIEAGRIISRMKDDGFDTEKKGDDYDLVTSADKASEDFITQQLLSLYPQSKILGEEANQSIGSYEGMVWMVDPLDGTSDFVHGGDAYSVMIGLCVDGIPSLGVVYLPAQDIVYYSKKGDGSFVVDKGERKKLSVSQTNFLGDVKKVVRIFRGEKRPYDMVIDKIPSKMSTEQSGVGTILGIIARGEADVYVFSNPRGSKWDTCGPQVILEEAGGKITDWDGDVLDYTQRSSQWSNLFIASNGSVHNEVLKYTKGKV